MSKTKNDNQPESVTISLKHRSEPDFYKLRYNTKLSIESINIGAEAAKQNLSNKMIASIIGITDKCFYDWLNRGESVYKRIENKELDEKGLNELDKYDRLAVIFYSRLRESRAERVSELTKKYNELGDKTTVDHVKEKILYKSLISMDKEHWSDKDQININQQFNIAGVRDGMSNPIITVAQLENAIGKTINDPDQRRKVISEIKGNIED